MPKDKRVRMTGRRTSGDGQFASLPYAFFMTAEFAALTPRAVKVLIELALQYRGNNNGDLDLTWARMSTRGFTSNEALQLGRDELIDTGWICVTRQGGRRWPTLYALTYRAIDPCDGKIDVPAGPPLHLWRPENAHKRETTGRSLDEYRNARRVVRKPIRKVSEAKPGAATTRALVAA